MRQLILLILATVLAAGEPLGGRSLATAAGAVAVPAATARLPGCDDAVAVALAEAAAAAGLGGRAWTLRNGLLTGWHLASEDALVCAGGLVLRREAAPEDDAAARRAALVAARDAAAASVDPGLPAVAADAVRALLARLDGGGAKVEGLAAADVRRLAASPWLDGLVTAEAASGLRAALAAAGPRPAGAFAGGGVRLERHADAFGGTVWVRRAPDGVAYAMDVAGPEYRAHLPWTLVVQLPAGADPWRDAARATAARLHWGGHELARWDGVRVEAEAARWSATLAPWGDDLEADWPAPHLALTAPDGAVLRLLVGEVALDAPRDGGDDGFVARAAVALRDPALLPLLGDTFFTYAHDSPDPLHPRLVGDGQRHGDLHQTAAATLATCLGGRFRGDCDDLAELYVAVLAEQGRLAHVMNLPRHAAAGWLEEKDGEWRMHVLHSGPAHCWSAASGPEAVVAAYQGMGDGTQPWRADQIAVLLRFAGENTRSPWRLSWRIYRDPAYSRTMVDVQRDWHFRTYHRGVAAMLALIAAGDADPANHSELSGLYRRIGDWPASLERFRLAAAARGGEPTVEDALEELHLLVLARRDAEAAAAARALAERIATLAGEDGQRGVELACGLVGTLDGAAHAGLRRELATRLVQPWFDAAVPTVQNWVRDRFDAATWGRDRFARAFLTAGGVLAELRVQPWVAAARDGGAPPSDREAAAWLSWWYDDICALPLGPESSPADTVASAAAWLSLRIGPPRMAQMLATARAPEAWDGKPVRFAGLLGAGTVAAWAGVSVPWVAHDMQRVAVQAPGAARSEAIAALLVRLDAARQATATMGLSGDGTEAQVGRTRLLAALVEGDRAHLDEAFAAIAARADRRELESTAGLLGAWARRLEPARFALAIERWFALVDQRPYALEPAWRALHATAWDAATVAAQAAARRHPEDAELVAEAGRIVALAAARRGSVPEQPIDDQLWVP